MASALAAPMAGCASSRGNAQNEVRVTAAETSAPARATVEPESAGDHADQIDKEVERGRTGYGVEATFGGRHLEFLIADSDGEALETEVPVESSSMPEPVQTADKE
jgi:hypothetical protein